ncbi:MAG: serine--tRNA ligase [Candidatus Kerfeldbacteria bacterium CG_4_10_14_0_8_um_filter_42_10]|uniref:Serine--tRNA ligase n=1 Tax=Candidatus Kerfeldbacteria bacterium CG_4_10_14_0_8_um_filter_42_10 TaxID=2014248 RepID=A0A2M7RJS4_9BACT|nr:MAG: serine--tRNA ligase [Candidatus Kerfeldbacteria bacterium CG_4_10_14_0_8_um_filter_42_10]
MIDIKFIRQNKEKVERAIKNKGIKVDVDRLLKKDEERRELLTEIEQKRSEQKKTADREKAKRLKNEISVSKKLLSETETEFNALLSNVPNLPAEDVKVGKDESENEIIKTVGEKTKFDFSAKGRRRSIALATEREPASGWKPQDHLAIGERLDLIDVKRAAKTSGARFGYLKNEAVLIQFALVRLALDILTKEKFKPMIPPVIVTGDSMKAMGYLEHGGEEETYHFEKDDIYFVGTSEQSIGPMHQNEILNAKDLPLRYVSYSTCFRREAGSYGKDVKGILRVHQFDKVEMFCFTKPEDSDQEHQYLLSLEEKLMQLLEIPYQVVKMCTGDLGNPAARKFDIEAWMPGQNQYRETHSTSNCTDFQARRLNIKYRNEKTGQNEFVHTLNGTAFAMGRTIIAILENYQQKDGSIKIPSVLEPYLGGAKEIRR